MINTLQRQNINTAIVIEAKNQLKVTKSFVNHCGRSGNDTVNKVVRKLAGGAVYVDKKCRIK